MMKMSGAVLSCCVALLLALTSVSAVPKLKSINSLKDIDFGSSVPEHSLVLLHWFANRVEIDDDNVIWLNFDTDLGDYGFHYYGNYEELLNPLPPGCEYYTVGNLYEDTSEQLPFYVRNTLVEDNRDRIVIRVQENGQGTLHRVEQVYITQHYDTYDYQGTPYDPDHTYQITTSLLRQIREFSVRQQQRPVLHLRNRFGRNIDNVQLNDIRHTWGKLACLGLLLLIVMEEKYSFSQRNNRPENNKTREHNNRPENNKTREISNKPENRQNGRGRCASIIAYVLIFFVGLVTLLSVYGNK